MRDLEIEEIEQVSGAGYECKATVTCQTDFHGETHCSVQVTCNF